jgi:hypothetical protein
MEHQLDETETVLLIPEQSPGEKNPLVQLAIDHTHIPLTETSETASFIPYIQCQATTLRNPACHINMYIHSNTPIYILEPTH